MCSELTNARKEIEKYMEIPFLLTLKAARVNKGMSVEEAANSIENDFLKRQSMKRGIL